MDLNKKVKIEFAPGCFDDFEGTQEELDSMIAEIEEAFNSDNAESLLAKSIPLNPDNLSEEQLAKIARAIFSEEEIEELVRMGMPAAPTKRNLQ